MGAGITQMVEYELPKLEVTGSSPVARFDFFKPNFSGGAQIFEILKNDTKSKARVGIIKTAHGNIETPNFMPVATLANVKTMKKSDLIDAGVDIVISNTYHLHLRPGEKTIKKLGGLHSFMNWDKPIATDSGGFQAFSLAKIRKIEDEGILFSSHIDGSNHFFTPTNVIDIQLSLDSDLIMSLDECPPYPIGEGYAEESLLRTIKWAKIGKEYFREKETNSKLFGIVQGSTYPHLRKRAVEEIVPLEFDGYAIGGIAVGEPSHLIREMTEFTVPLLPESRPRYLMGVGLPEDIVFAVSQGVDLFDCVIPTRNGRTGTLYTKKGKINIKNTTYKEDPAPIEEGCGCYTCQHYSKAYLRHLFISNELLAQHLGTIHNIYYFTHLMKDIREKIVNGTFWEWSHKLLKN